MLRYSFLGGAVICFTSLAIAYFYMELYLDLDPCPLCILDRIVVAAMGLAFLLSALVFLRGSPVLLKTLWTANVVFLCAGFVFAIRHVWLQRRPPDEAAGCLADSPTAQTLTEIVRLAFDASGDCGAVYWEFAGLTIPEQVLILFIFFAALLFTQAVALFGGKGGKEDPGGQNA